MGLEVRGGGVDLGVWRDVKILELDPPHPHPQPPFYPSQPTKGCVCVTGGGGGGGGGGEEPVSQLPQREKAVPKLMSSLDT